MILLDEIEKAHRDVFNILLQVLDDGRLSDNHGHTVDFTNTIIVMTSNIGSQVIQEIARGRRQRGGDARGRAWRRCRPASCPSSSTASTRSIIFHPLEPDADPQDRRPAGRAAARSSSSEKGIELDVTDAALDAIAAEGYDPTYGARPLKRVIQQQIQNPLATEILKGQFGEGTTDPHRLPRRRVRVQPRR